MTVTRRSPDHHSEPAGKARATRLPEPSNPAEPTRDTAPDGLPEPVADDQQPGADRDPDEDARPSLWTLRADAPIHRVGSDELGFGVYANAFAETLDSPHTTTPLTVAVTGAWGSGKTSLTNLTLDRLEQMRQDAAQPPHVVCWFNAWMHDDAPSLSSAIATEVTRCADRERRGWQRLLRPIPFTMRTPMQRRLRVSAFIALALVIAVVALVPREGRDLVQLLMVDGDLRDDLESTLSPDRAAVALLVLGAISLASRLLTLGRSIAQFARAPESTAAQGLMNDVHEQLGRLIGQATGRRRRLIVVVDDLERCRPPRALEVCEVVSQLLNHSRVIVILIADISMIESSASIKYRDLEGDTPERGDESGYGRRYLQKIVNFELVVPRPSTGQMRHLLIDSDVQPAHRAGMGADLTSRAGLANAATAMLPVDPGRSLFQVAGLVPYALGLVLWLGTDLGWPAVVAWSIGVGMLGMLVAAVSMRRDARRTQRSVKWIDQAIESRARSGDSLDSGAIASSSHAPTDSTPLIEQRLRRFHASRSEFMRDTEIALLDYQQPVPRGAIRLLNRTRFYVTLAWEKGLIDQRDLDACKVAKWVALTDRHPQLAALFTEDTDALQQLESGVDLEGWAQRHGVKQPRQALADQLAAEPRLSGVVKLLSDV